MQRCSSDGVSRAGSFPQQRRVSLPRRSCQDVVEAESVGMKGTPFFFIGRSTLIHVNAVFDAVDPGPQRIEDSLGPMAWVAVLRPACRFLYAAAILLCQLSRTRLNARSSHPL